MKNTAVLSDCECYRYTLERSWADDPRYLLYIMLNPSTADAEKDDATIRRCIGFAKTFGFTGILVGNLYGWRARYPHELASAHARGKDVVGQENDTYLHSLAQRASLIICAWGQLGPIPTRANALHNNWLWKYKTHALGRTKDQYPRHPLMLPRTAQPQAYP